MPLHWTSVDTRNAILCAAVPSISVFAGTMIAIKDQELLLFLKNKNFPPVAGRCKYSYLVANTAATAPFGYASYLLYKIGGGFDYTDTTVAIGLYAATLLTGGFMFFSLKMQNAKAVTANACVLAGLSIGTTLAFYTIDKISAYWTLPFTLSALLYAGLTLKAFCAEKKDA